MPNPNHIVMCPFYETHAGLRPWQYTITCESIKNNMGFHMRNQLRFDSIEEQQNYMDLFCCSFEYAECPYYEAIYEKYEKCKGEKDR